MCLLGTKLKTSRRVVNSSNNWAISPAPKVTEYFKTLALLHELHFLFLLSRLITLSIQIPPGLSEIY